MGHEAHVALEPIRHLPAKLRRVWNWFLNINRAREYERLTEPVQMPDGRLGWRVKSFASPIGPERINAWMHLSRLTIEPWQFAALQLMDEFYVSTTNNPPAPAMVATASNLAAMFKALGKAKKK